MMISWQEKALRDELVRISKLEIALRANMPSTTIDDIIRLLQEGREALEHKLRKLPLPNLRRGYPTTTIALSMK